VYFIASVSILIREFGELMELKVVLSEALLKAFKERASG